MIGSLKKLGVGGVKEKKDTINDRLLEEIK
jgi:hypothetical protein